MLFLVFIMAAITNDPNPITKGGISACMILMGISWIAMIIVTLPLRPWSHSILSFVTALIITVFGAHLELNSPQRIIHNYERDYVAEKIIGNNTQAEWEIEIICELSSGYQLTKKINFIGDTQNALLQSDNIITEFTNKNKNSQIVMDHLILKNIPKEYGQKINCPNFYWK